MFNNFQIDSSSIDHGISMSDNSQFEHVQQQLSQQQQQAAFAPQPQLNAASSSTTPPSSTPSTSHAQDAAANGTPGPSTSAAAVSPPKPAYGSGEADDGYTLVFANLEEFQAWRAREEEEKIVEFVKGDTHGSKAVPPRFKDHTKLVCARHTRSGRKKYVKKYPERQRKLPSRKIEGEGCPASISYKTFFHTDQVRACYNDKHSHEIGEANLLFTRRGRKAANEKGKLSAFRAAGLLNGTPAADASPTAHQNGAAAAAAAAVAAAAASAAPTSTTPQNSLTPVPQPPQPPAPPPQQQHDPSIAPSLPHPHMASAIALLAPLPPPPPPPAVTADAAQDRWDRMAVLFASVRQHARSFEYPAPSVAALESVLIRLYLESPLAGGGGGMDGMGGSAGS